MSTHLENLEFYIPDLIHQRIVDVGSGRGSFLIDVATRGGSAIGIEICAEYITMTHEAATRAGVTVSVLHEKGESLPLADNSADFVNVCEVIEHVNDPVRTLREVYRIVRPGGHVYMSVPNRFGLKDQHFHLYFVNWLPRFLANPFISLWGTHKIYDGKSGEQNLARMHYYTFYGIKKLAEHCGFSVQDMRCIKLKKRFSGLTLLLVFPVYYCARLFFFDSAHLLLTKDFS